MLRAKSDHLFGPWPDAGASDDTINLHAIHELHAVLDWLAEIAPDMDSIRAGRTDLTRLEARHEPETLRRDHYVDRRLLDPVESRDRAFLILLMFFVAAHDGMTPRVLLEKLGVGVTYTSPLNH